MRVSKKIKYFIHALAIGLLLFWFSFAGRGDQVFIGILTLLVVLLGTFITQYPNIRPNNLSANVLFPLHLITAALFSFVFYPNLSIPFKLLAVFIFCLLFYIFLLVNNIFLVVEEKKEIIPLYRVAVTWTQILLIIVAIPYFAGTFKIPFNVLTQNFSVAFSSFLFSLYFMWILKFDKDVKKAGVGETYFLSLFVSFLVFFAGLGVSFAPNESFLRALFVSSFLMFGLSYIQAHIKNNIDKNLIYEFLLIFIVFFIILYTFNP